VALVSDLAPGAAPVGAEPIGGRRSDAAPLGSGLTAGDRITVDIAAGQRGAALHPSELSWRTLATVRAVAWTRGSNGVTLPKPSSIAVDVDDSAGRLDVLTGQAAMSDPVRVRLDGTANAPNLPLFHGLTAGLHTTYKHPAVALLRVRALDGMRLLASRPLTAEIAADRIDIMVGAVLTAAGWPAADRAVQQSVRSAPAIPAGVSALRAIDELTRAEGPTATRWVAANGDFVWRARRAITAGRSATPQIVLSNVSGSIAPRWAALDLGVDDADVFPRASVTDTAANVIYEAADAAAVERVGPLTRRYSASYGAAPQGEAPYREVDAKLLVELHKNSAPQVRSAVIKPVRDDGDFAALADLDLQDRVRCLLRTPWAQSGQKSIDGHVRFIRWVARSTRLGAELEVELSLTPAAPYDELHGDW